jgi:hypothetical protein
MTAAATVPTTDLSGAISLTTQVSGTLPIANGGTGATTAAAALTALGAAASGANTDITSLLQSVSVSPTGAIAADSLGFRGLPVAGGAPKTANYALALGDAGKDVQMNATGLTVTIPANASVAFPNGTTIIISNLFAGNLTLAITTDTLTVAGTTTGGAGVSRTVAQNGQVTIVKKTATVWWVAGPGLS